MSLLRPYTAQTNQHFFEDFFSDFYKPLAQAWKTEKETFIRADIVEQEDRFYISLDVPGFSKDQIHLDYKDGVLSIVGKRELKKENKKAFVHLMERFSGGFKRSFEVRHVNSEAIEASYDQGVLTVLLPKNEDKKAKKISIEEGKSFVEKIAS